MNSEKILLTRRGAIVSGLLAGVSGLMFPGLLVFGEEAEDFSARMAELEKKSGGRLGCAMLDTGTGKRIAYRGEERFAMCSTFKLMAASLALKRVEEGKERMDRRIRFDAKDVVSHSPATGKRVGGEGMTIAELCEAAITLSDNTAANLLLGSFGGPEALTTFLRSIGDGATRLDRIEPFLNDAVPGDPRDTTTPEAMLENLRCLVLGDVLAAASRERLTSWMAACQTGLHKLRAGLPADWKVGDKTGAGDNGTSNDIAVAWPPHRAPVLASVYLTESKLSDDATNAIVAEVGNVVAAALKRG